MHTTTSSQSDHSGFPLALRGRFGDTAFQATIDHPDTLDALARFSTPEQGVTELMRIGACATLAASAGFDLQAFRDELNDAIEKATGSLTQHAAQLSATVGADGPLATTLATAIVQLQHELHSALDEQTDLDTPGSFLARIQGSLRSFDRTLATVKHEIATEFRETADRQARAFSRSVQDVKNLDPASGLGQAIAGMQTQLRELRELVATNQTRASERLKGAAKGHDFGLLVTETIAEIAGVHGDVVERTGDRPGLLIKDQGAAKGGDVTISIVAPPYPSVVVEAMNRSTLTVKGVQHELDRAMQNRGAQVAIAVIANPDHPIMCGQPLKQLGRCAWVAGLDPEEPNLQAVKCAYQLARHAAIAVAISADVDATEIITETVENVNRLLTTANKLRTQISNIGHLQNQSVQSVETLYRDAEALIRKLQMRLQEQAA